jgi:RNA polymerase sigma-70 factor (ECF subfamily)
MISRDSKVASFMAFKVNGAFSLAAFGAVGAQATPTMRQHDITEPTPLDPSAPAIRDEGLLTMVYHAHSGAIHSYAFRLLGNQEDADDVTQEVFIRAHERLDQLRDPDRLRPWLYRIATNLCMDNLRKRTRTRRIFGIPIYLDGGGDEDDGTGPHDVAQPGSANAFDGVAERDHINRALRRMAPKYATCLVLHSAQGLSYREIAEAFGITPGAAAVRLARARDMFARHYDDVRKEGQR